MRKFFQKLGLIREMNRGRGRASRVLRKTAGVWPEQLEQRKLLAVTAMEFPVVDELENWVTVIADNDDVYIQHAANPERDTFVADNGAFANPIELPGFLTQYDTLNIFEGQVLQAADLSPAWAPFVSADRGDTLRFEVPHGFIDTTSSISGVLIVDEQTIFFSNNGTGVSLENDYFGVPINAIVTNSLANINPAHGNVGDMARIELQHPQFSDIVKAGSTVRLQTLTYDVHVSPTIDFSTTAVNLPALTEQTVYGFDDVNWSDGTYVPGTIRGSLTFESLGVNEVLTFQSESLNRGDRDGLIPLSFYDQRDPHPLFQVTTYGDALDGYVTNDTSFTRNSRGSYDGGPALLIAGTPSGESSSGISLEGAFDPVTGTLQFIVNAEIREYTVPEGSLRASTTNRSVAPVSGNITVHNLEAGWYSGDRHRPVRATVFPGLTHSIGLNVEMPTPGSDILIESPIETTGTDFGQGDILLSASEIVLNAPVFASQEIVVPAERSSWLGTRSERFTVNATTSAPQYAIQLVDDVRTPSVGRSQLVVSQSGSLSASPNVLVNPPANLTPSVSSFIEIIDGDGFIEGTVAASLQSFVMSSDVGSEAEAPYVLTTKSRLTGIDTGSIQGDTLSLTLGNDTLGGDFLSLATSEVSLSTDVNRLRTQAASRVADPLREMFPYKLSIEEANDLIIDAVAGSSEKIEINAGGSLSLLGAIRSQQDVALESVADFQVSAPISTSFGSISLRGPNVTVNSPVRILDAIQDERIVDIAVEATSATGGLVLNDAISALNRVDLVTAGSLTGSARVRGDVVYVDADGEVSFSTAANLVTVDTPSSVRVEDEGAVAFEIRESSDVTLISHGYDRLVDHDGDPGTDDVLSPALFADVYNTTNIVVSAPNGSVDVLHKGSQAVVVGDIDEINAGVEVTPGTSAMLAGGSAIVRSTLSPQITVQDFPNALSGAERVRLATTKPLPAESTYTPGAGEPGTYATSLSFTLPYSGEDNRLEAFDNVKASELRVGDRILIKDGKYADSNQVDVEEHVNGIYVVLKTVYNENRNAAVTVFLVRATTHDESSELRDRSYVTVTGVADPASRIDEQINTLAGKSFASNGFDVVDPFSNNLPYAYEGEVGRPATGIDIEAVPSQPGYLVASAMSSGSIVTEAVFNEAQEPDSDGLWIDTIESVVEQPISEQAAMFGGVVLVQEDLVLVRGPVTGGNYSNQIGELTDEAIGLYRVHDPGSAESTWKLKRYDGYDENGDGVRDRLVEGVVTIAGGLARTAVTGEMFKMSYRGLHVNDLEYQPLENYSDLIVFDRQNSANTQIPVFDSNANVRTDIGMNNPNGIVQFEITTEGGTNAFPGSLGRMLGLVQSNSAYVPRTREPQEYTTVFNQSVQNIVLEQQLPTIRKQIEISPDVAVAIDGSEITQTRDGAVVPVGTITAGIGPVRPSQVNSARRLVRDGDLGNVFLNGLEFGPGSDGSRVSNVSMGGFNTGSAIYVAGAGNILIDGVNLGEDVNGGPLPNQYGVYVTQVAGGAGTDFTTITNSSIGSSTNSGIFLGLNANNVRVVANEDIGSLVTTVDRRGNVVGVTNDSVSGRNLIGAAPILDPVENVLAIARQNKLKLPADFNRDDLYLGQEVVDFSGSDEVIDSGTLIREINVLDSGETELTLSTVIKDTQTISLGLSTSENRNRIQYNEDGVVLESGSSRMVMTDVTNSVFDGISIRGVAADGEHVIGGVGYAGAIGQNIPNRDNNAIHSNGLSGIKFTDAFFAGLSNEEKIEKVNRVKVRGNFIGTDIDNNTGRTNGLDGSSNFVVEPSLDLAGNQTANDDNAFIRAILLQDATPEDNDPRDSGLYYTARYRPEDNPLLEDRENIDAEGNGQVVGEPLTGTFPGGGGSGPTDPEDPRGPSAPPTMR